MQQGGEGVELSAIDFDHQDQIKGGDTNHRHALLSEIMRYFESVTNKNVHSSRKIPV